jgi:ribosomal protein S18 acetylase RimI-like enzyme
MGIPDNAWYAGKPPGAADITIAEPADLPAIVGIVRRATRAMVDTGIDQWDELYPDASRLCDDIAAGTLYVIRFAGRPAGIVALNEAQEPEYTSVDWRFGGRALVVHRLVMDPRFQRRGLATLLMRFAEAQAAGRYDAIRLDAFGLNVAALALYKRLGYRQAGTVCFRKGEFVCFEKALSEVETDSGPV